jgi:hypothetical protein
LNFVINRKNSGKVEAVKEKSVSVQGTFGSSGRTGGSLWLINNLGAELRPKVWRGMLFSQGIYIRVSYLYNHGKVRTEGSSPTQVGS